jgi:hypothetical protein
MRIADFCGVLSPLCLSLLLTPSAARAADRGDDGQWRTATSLYAWAAGVEGETRDDQDIDLSFSDLAENLDLALMGTVEARRDRWSLLADFVYVELSETNRNRFEVPITPGLPPSVDVKTKVELEQFVSTVAGGYNLADGERGTHDLVAGARYLSLDTTITLDANAEELSRSRELSGSQSGWDGIVGLRGRFNLSDKWFLPYFLDVGAGNSDLTWQAFAGVGYEFRRIDVVAAYRHMAWEFDDDSLLNEFALSGAVLGARFRF